jgi:preprotein translocase subunit SecA
LIGSNVLTKVFGTSNERVVKRLLPRVAEINALEPQVKAMSDEQLRAKTAEFKARIAAALEGITEEEARGSRRRSRRSRTFCPRRSRWCARRDGAP